jgi:hypothetical protein
MVTVRKAVVMPRAVGRLEDEQAGQVQAAVVAGELELVGAAEVVRQMVLFFPGSGARWAGFSCG